jgi:hypothetical protein
VKSIYNTTVIVTESSITTNVENKEIIKQFETDQKTSKIKLKKNKIPETRRS